MVKLQPNMKVACICRGGQVRSIAARHILADKFGFKKVLACGWEKNEAWENADKTLCANHRYCRLYYPALYDQLGMGFWIIPKALLGQKGYKVNYPKRTAVVNMPVKSKECSYFGCNACKDGISHV